MPEEIQIRDPDGSSNAVSASAPQAQHSTSTASLNALRSVQPDRLNLEELNAREARYGQRKPMGPPLAEESAVTADEVDSIEPMPAQEEG